MRMIWDNLKAVAVKGGNHHHQRAAAGVKVIEVTVTVQVQLGAVVEARMIRTRTVVTVLLALSLLCWFRSVVAAVLAALSTGRERLTMLSKLSRLTRHWTKSLLNKRLLVKSQLWCKWPGVLTVISETNQWTARPSIIPLIFTAHRRQHRSMGRQSMQTTWETTCM